MSAWLTVECERALYVDRGRDVILCDRLPSPVTLVVKLASAGRNPTGEDPQGLRAEHEHAVPHGDAADAQPPHRDGSGNATSGNPLPVKHGD